MAAKALSSASFKDASGQTNEPSSGKAHFEAFPQSETVDVFVLIEIDVELNVGEEDLVSGLLNEEVFGVETLRAQWPDQSPDDTGVKKERFLQNAGFKLLHGAVINLAEGRPEIRLASGCVDGSG